MAEAGPGGEAGFLVVGLGGLAFRPPPGLVEIHDAQQLGAGRR